MTSTALSVTDDPTPRWEIERQARTFVSRLRWAGRLILIGAAILIVAQVASVYRLFHDIHPWAGLAAATLFVALLAWFLGRPVMGLLRLPRAVTPPRLAPIEERTVDDWNRQLRYIRRYLQSLRANPELSERTVQIDAALAALDELRGRQTPQDAWNTALTEFEQRHMKPLLTELDAKVDALIHREALAVGTMTALSPNGSLDVFLVLWRNVNMVATISRLYYGRPGLRGTALVVRDVASAVLLASVLEKLSDMSASLVRKMGEGSRAIPIFGALVGPALDGVVNAIMTMKLGYLARERCHSFQAWDGRTTTNVLERSFKAVGMNGRAVLDELFGRIGGPLGWVRSTADAGVETVQEVSSRTLDWLTNVRRWLTGDRRLE